MSPPQYPLAAGCEAHLDSWCMDNCPHAQLEVLHARLDTNQQRQPPLWRCYAISTLDSKATKYVQGTRYCTRHAQLSIELNTCRSSGQSLAYQSEMVFGPRGSNSGEASVAAMASVPLARAPADPLTEQSCEDKITECAVWAAYQECHTNPSFMLRTCPVSCQSCSRRANGVPRNVPSQTLPVRSNFEAATVESTSSRLPVQHARTAASRCREPCDVMDADADSVSPGSCSGHGSCSAWNGKNWCACINERDARYVGLRCERKLSLASTCPERCNQNGLCVNGYCASLPQSRRTST